MSTASGRAAPSFSSPEIRAEIALLREVDNSTNLGYLAFEYLCMASVIGLVAAFAENRESLGIAWGWNIPVFGLGIVLIGGLQHRLAGLGHEASHYSLLRNKWANDLVGDVFCFFPILATVHFYRLFHMAHHQFTNNPALDPDLVNLGRGKRVADFPMGRLRFILTRLPAPLVSPLSFVRYQWEYFYVNALGKGANVYMKRRPDGDASEPWPRVGTILGLAYLLVAIAIQNVLMRSGPIEWLIPAGLIGIVLVVLASYLLPDRWVYRSPFRQAYSERFAGALRLSTYTAALVALGWLRVWTNGRSSPYLYLLWFVPLLTTFPYFMLLRDTYQHTNADAGRLTNTRVFRCDPFTHWAVFVYGQDLHVPHHLFPTVPHHGLGRLHHLLMDRHEEYARDVVEVHGTFANRKGAPTILDVLSESSTRQGGSIAQS